MFKVGPDQASATPPTGANSGERSQVNLITLRDGQFAEVRAYFDTSQLPSE